ncbi:MAG: very short patch repair endonuclease [Peptococcaceae bacterium]|nr:very short patch repair endonuclease [Peptococcaceae bacterium]
MRQVKSSGNKSTEEKMITFFREEGITGWRRNYKVFGKPDFVFHKQKVAVFLDGCFWHGHNCRNTHPKQNEDYWQRKISCNMARDEEVTRRLEKLGWTVVRIWECELLRKNQTVLKEKILPLLSPIL